MKQQLTRLACSALLGLAIGGAAAVGSAQAQSAGAMTAPALAIGHSAEAAATAELVGHRYHRRHYRRHDRHGGGVYFRFGGGSFSLTVPPPRYYPRYRRHYDYPRASYSRHVDWCYARYKSYRHWDNTFQPYHGPRRQCFSPYD